MPLPASTHADQATSHRVTLYRINHSFHRVNSSRLILHRATYWSVSIATETVAICPEFPDRPA